MTPWKLVQPEPYKASSRQTPEAKPLRTAPGAFEASSQQAPEVKPLRRAMRGYGRSSRQAEQSEHLTLLRLVTRRRQDSRFRQQQTSPSPATLRPGRRVGQKRQMIPNQAHLGSPSTSAIPSIREEPGRLNRQLTAPTKTQRTTERARCRSESRPRLRQHFLRHGCHSDSHLVSVPDIAGGLRDESDVDSLEVWSGVHEISGSI